MAELIEVGHVDSLWLYPFKEMRGVKVQEVTVKSVSVLGDRRRGYQRVNTNQEFAWLTHQQFPGLLLYSPYYVDPSKPDKSEIRVKTPKTKHSPAGRDYSADSIKLRSEIARKSRQRITLVKMGRAEYHSMPVSVVTLASSEQIGREVNADVDPRRFRQNVYIRTDSNTPYEEMGWLGQFLVFSDREDRAQIHAQILAVKPDSRCMTVNLDPDTAESNPEILRAIARNHNNELGIYCSPATAKPGRIKVEDAVYLSNGLLG